MRPAPFLAELILQERKRLDLNQTELASRLGLTRRRISGFEGQKYVPKPEELALMKRHLRLSGADLQAATAEIPGDPRLKRKFRHSSYRLSVFKDRASSKRYWRAKQAWPRLIYSPGHLDDPTGALHGGLSLGRAPRALGGD